MSINLQQIVIPESKPPLISKLIYQKKIEFKKEPFLEKKILDIPKKVFAKKSNKKNNVSKIKSKKPSTRITKKIVKIKFKKTKVIKKRIVKKDKRSNNSLANLLMGSGTSMYPQKRTNSSPSSRYASKMINQLYGREFDTYTPTQKRFIKDNLSIIHRITQRTLTQNGYPEVAIRTKQEGTNVVSFYLHPNGDISGLRLKRRMGYAALDENTLNVIRIAYKDYPLPNQKTRMLFYVNYSIY